MHKDQIADIVALVVVSITFVALSLALTYFSTLNR
jgi:hypothetical protein